MMQRAILALIGAEEWRGPVQMAADRYALAPRETGRPSLMLFSGARLPVARAEPHCHILGDRFGSGSQAWGNFIEIAAPPVGDVVVRRASLTGMPLYWREVEGGVLFFSHLELVEKIGVDFSVDTGFLRYLLAFGNFRAPRTGLIGVQELYPGTRLRFGTGPPIMSSAWSPWPHARARFAGEDAAAQLETRIMESVSAWAAGRSSIVVELSGGLDSSIVAAALAKGGHDFDAATIATRSPDGDERHFARAVAERCGASLAEFIHGDAPPDLVAGPAFLSPRPATYGVLAGIDAALGAAAASDRDASIFSGIGGDNVFAINRSIVPVLDAFRSLGPGRRSFAALRDCARLCNATIWKAGRVLWREQRRKPSGDWPRDDGYCVRASLPDAPLAHPWDGETDDLPVGKIRHVQSIQRIGDFLDRPGRWYGRDVVAPLLSQPVVELCLSIATWEWVTGGRDRAVARAAFAPHLPDKVVWRRNKGRLETMCAEAFLAQRSALARILLEGRLAREGLVDRPRVEAYLARDRIENDYDYFRLLELADIELWVESVDALGGGGTSKRSQRAY